MMENILEDLLYRSSKNKSLYYDFITELLKSEIYVPLHDDNMESDRIPVVVWKDRYENKVIPFFTSKNALKKSCLKVFGSNDVKYITMNGKKFFRRLRDCNAVLNPNLEIAKEFTCDEIQQINLKYSNWLLNVEAGERVLFYQPKELPLTLLLSLMNEFEKISPFGSFIYSRLSICRAAIEDYDLVGIRISGDFNLCFSKFENYLENNKNELKKLRFINLNQENEIVNQLVTNGHILK